MKKFEITRIKEVGKKTVADFIRSETGSVGVRNAATISAFAGVFALSQSNSAAHWENHQGTWFFVIDQAI